MNVRILSATLAALFCVSAGLVGAPSEREVRRAIHTLIQNPGSAAAQKAGLIVLKFAEATPDHKVVISLGYLPWAKNRNLPDGSKLLLAAFVAGNLQEQLRKGSSKPEPYAGCLAIIQVYQKILRENPGFRIPKVDEFIAMEKRGTLRAHIADVKP